jgi:hypothetical protein
MCESAVKLCENIYTPATHACIHPQHAAVVPRKETNPKVVGHRLDRSAYNNQIARINPIFLQIGKW